MFEYIRKCDGKIFKFDPLEITSAIATAGRATAVPGEENASKLTDNVLCLTLPGEPFLRLELGGIQPCAESRETPVPNISRSRPVWNKTGPN